MSGLNKRKPAKGRRDAEKYAKKLKLAIGKDDYIRKATYDDAQEFEFDSEPIEESSTANESGEDDGVSWPSGGEATEDEENGGVALPTGTRPEAAQQSAGSTNKVQSKMSMNIRKGQLNSAHAKQKAITQERRAIKPNADMIARSKKIWEKLRMGTLSRDERKRLIEELFDIVTGRVKEFVLKHDAGRVIQTALKYGSASQRRIIAEELRGEYQFLAKSKYAKFTIGKLLSHNDEIVRDIIVPELYGNVRNLIRHPEAGWILDDIYRGAATKRQKSRMLREWYGPEFSILKTGSDYPDDANLNYILALRPEKRSPILRYLLDTINLLIQKRTTGFTMLHDAMLQYYTNVEPGSERGTEFVEIILGDDEGDLLKNLAFTRSGAHLLSLFLANGSAKERKSVLRVFKGHIPALAYDINGHQVLLTALEVIDDTVLTSKVIYSELLPGSDGVADGQLLAQCEHPAARVPLLLPFAHKAASILPERSKGLFTEIQQIRSRTSKKNPAVRSSELARFVAPSLLSLITRQAKLLLRSSFGCILIQEVLLSTSHDIPGRERARDAIIALIDPARIEKLDTSDAEEMNNLLNSPAVTRLLKTLVYSGHFNTAHNAVEVCPSPLNFAAKLCDVAFVGQRGEEELVQWATGFRVFVVEALLRSENLPNDERENLRETLARHVDRLHKVAAAPIASAKTRKPTDIDKHSADAAARIGSKGAKSILDLLNATK